MNAPAPRLWTGEAVLDHALEVAGFDVADLKRSMAVTREALDAETPSTTRYDRNGDVREVVEGGADHAIRLRASENIFGWLGLRGARKPVEGPERPIAINIAIVSSDAGHASQANGVAIRFSGGNGSGT